MRPVHWFLVAVLLVSTIQFGSPAVHAGPDAANEFPELARSPGTVPDCAPDHCPSGHHGHAVIVEFPVLAVAASLAWSPRAAFGAPLGPLAPPVRPPIRG